MKYEYLLHTWGGFYNDENQKIHKEVRGYHYFNTETERDNYLTKLKKIESTHNIYGLMFETAEGYLTRIETILHRIINWNGKEYYTEYKLPHIIHITMHYILSTINGILDAMIIHLGMILTMIPIQSIQYKNG